MCLCVLVLLKPLKQKLRYSIWGFSFVVVYSTGYFVEEIISSRVSFLESSLIAPTSQQLSEFNKSDLRIQSWSLFLLTCPKRTRLMSLPRTKTFLS